MSPFTWRRQAARVVLLDESGHVLLIEASDPADASKQSWWEIPGGGIDPHESSHDAARRELHEETGITSVEIGPCVWVQHSVFSFGGYNFDQHERIHVAWCDARHAIEAAAMAPRLEALEAMAFGSRRWWHIDELLSSDVRVLPHRLREFLPDLIDGIVPDEPHDITHHGGWD